MSSDYDKFALVLTPQDIDLIHNICTIGVRTGATPKWAKDITREFLDSIDEQDAVYSRAKFMDAAEYKVTQEQSEALAFVIFTLLKEAYPKQRNIYADPESRHKVTLLFDFIDNIHEQYVDFIKGL